MTFSTFVTPTRESEIARVGACAWTSSSVISDIAPPRLVRGICPGLATPIHERTPIRTGQIAYRVLQSRAERQRRAFEPRPDSRLTSRHAARLHTIGGRSDSFGRGDALAFC